MKRTIIFHLSLFILAVLAGCGIKVNVVEDEYSLEKIDGDITCEYRIGKDARWSEECVDSEVRFDKDMFLKLFQEYLQYEPITGSMNPLEYNYLKIDIDEQPEEWQMMRDSEFNVRAVFGGDQRDVSIYRYRGKLYFYVLSMGDSRDPEKEGEYFIELSEEMSDYWQPIIEAIGASLSR